MRKCVKQLYLAQYRPIPDGLVHRAAYIHPTVFDYETNCWFWRSTEERRPERDISMPGNIQI